MSATIIYTKTDEAPALATYALLPVIEAYCKAAGVNVETRDISLAGRIIANFPDKLDQQQKIGDHLAELGELAKTPEANIIKLPNISASIPQLQAAIRELQGQGYDIPAYPEEPENDQERELQRRFANVLGSAVNPVLREGNSDRRPAESVKRFAQKNPHRMMKDWPETSGTRVAHMTDKDYYATETSLTLSAPCTARIEFADTDGDEQVLKDNIPLLAGEVIDSAVLNVAALRTFFAEQIEAARTDNLLLSLHLKATMMKISDPIMFGHCVSVYFQEVMDKYKDKLEAIGANPNYGLADILDKVDRLDDSDRAAVQQGIEAALEHQPDLAMVDSDRGITNLHVPNDVIVDASMPVVVRDGGRMWNPDGELQDVICMIPDRSYATMYQAIIADCQKHGQFDPATMGSVSNVGLMAKKAEEYGSHDKTFEAPDHGTVKVVDDNGTVLLEQPVEPGDIFRMCQTKDEPIRDWVKLAVTRARESGTPAVFWLDEARGHDRELIALVNKYLPEHDTDGLDIRIMPPVEAMNFSLERIRRGKNTISVTGNVLRDYLTDLFPILELGTSARMLSIVPLMNGGGLFETGAGGSAPKHVQQFEKEGHLRWDSLGEYCALVPSLELVANNDGNEAAAALAKALDRAIEMYLENSRTPSRKVNELDNRGSTFYLSLYWAQALAGQQDNPKLAEKFAQIAESLAAAEQQIVGELNDAQGDPVELGGYYRPDDGRAESAMRPSPTWNQLLSEFND